MEPWLADNNAYSLINSSFLQGTQDTLAYAGAGNKAVGGSRLNRVFIFSERK